MASSVQFGPDKDVPAGDIGVGAREITYMYNKYVELTGKHDCALTGKPLELCGSLARKEATGYGLVYFVAEYLKDKGQTLDGKKVLISATARAHNLTNDFPTAANLTALKRLES